jgi:SAM-dependent methyltransferase
VLAIDLRRQSLAFLWMRARLKGYGNLQVIHGDVADPRLPQGAVDAVLIANTYHELTEPRPILKALFTAMRPGARLVVVERGPRDGEAHAEAHHASTPAEAESEISQQGFVAIRREERFIDGAGDVGHWWLVVFQRK